MPGPSPSPENALDDQLVLDRLRSMLTDIIGEEYVSTLEIEPETSFRADLEIESIELVALGEALQEEYRHVDFAAWLATMDVDEIIGMTVGDLVDHIVGPNPPQSSVTGGERHG